MMLYQEVLIFKELILLLILIFNYKIILNIFKGLEEVLEWDKKVLLLLLLVQNKKESRY